MPGEIRAVVIKTPRLRETKEFYEKMLGLEIVESSSHHFVTSASEMRFVFVAGKIVEFEIYIAAGVATCTSKVEFFNDSNGIRIMRCS